MILLLLVGTWDMIVGTDLSDGTVFINHSSYCDPLQVVLDTLTLAMVNLTLQFTSTALPVMVQNKH